MSNGKDIYTTLLDFGNVDANHHDFGLGQLVVSLLLQDLFMLVTSITILSTTLSTKNYQFVPLAIN